MKIGIVISAIDPENLWNAFRFWTFTQKKGDQVTVFLIGKGVDCYTKDTEQFKITEQMDALVAAGGVINA